MLKVCFEFMPGSTRANERLLSKFIFPDEMVAFKDLPTERQNEIMAYAKAQDIVNPCVVRLIREYACFLRNLKFPGTKRDEKRIKEHATGYENEVGEILESWGVSYTQSDTDVDFLLDSPIQVYGQVVHWIECKDTYGSTLAQRSIIFRKRVTKQLARYVEKHGTGLLAFSKGCSWDFKDYSGVKTVEFNQSLFFEPEMV
jgi:hypothetical protein